MIPNNSYSILIAQIIAHLSIIPLVIYGEFYHYAIAIFVYFLNGCLGMTMTYHRLLTHRSWNCPKLTEYIFSLFATIGLTGSALSWVAIHREHHAFTDTSKDPHSPAYRGWMWSHYFSMFAKVKIRYVRDLLNEKFYTYQHKFYFEINLVYGIILFYIDPFAPIYAWLVPAALLWNGGSLIVSTSHRSNGPHNDLIFVLTTWGEGYHKNHHDDVRLSRFGKYDLGGIIIDKFKKYYKASSLG